MKSFSSTSFPKGESEAETRAFAALETNPQAHFTDFQWFLYHAQNTVYFSAFSSKEFSHQYLIRFVGNIVALAPQLTHGFTGARPGQPLSPQTLEAITTLEEVDELDGYPDKWIEPGLALFSEDQLPLFRVKVVVRRNGPDKQGRHSMIIVRASHALMEGADSALLTRSQDAAHGSMSSAENKLSLKQRLVFALVAVMTAPIHLVTAHLLSPKVEEMGFASMIFDRQQLRRVANKINVRQRALMFGIVMFALNAKAKALATRKIKTIYTTLAADSVDADDDFFRVRSINANFDVHDDLRSFLKKVDQTIGKVEAKSTSSMQLILNATFKAHRLLSSVFPFLYGPRFFRYNGGYDMVLTLVPPHRMRGDLTSGMMEPIYCGSYHPGSNLCTFVPGVKTVTFNFSMYAKHLPQIDDIADLLDHLDTP